MNAHVDLSTEAITGFPMFDLPFSFLFFSSEFMLRSHQNTMLAPIVCPLTDSLPLIVFFSCLVLVQPAYVKLPATWTNVLKSDRVYHFTKDHTAGLILYEAWDDQVALGCGFYCKGNNCKIGSYTLSIFVVASVSNAINADVEPSVVWSANRDHSVGINATLELTMEGDLVVKDADGSIAWSAGTSGKSVVAMNFTDRGNLMLLDVNNNTIWQSFDYPTDTLLLGQRLRVGQKLAPSASPADQNQEDIFSLSLAFDGLFAMVATNSSRPIVYYSMNLTGNNSSYIRFSNGSLDLVVDTHSSRSMMNLRFPWTIQFMNLSSDGHLRLYDYNGLFGATEVDDLLPLDQCNYPTACGHYGVCSFRHCSCLPSSGDGITYFKKRDEKQPKRGCSEMTPLTCGASNNQTFLEIENLDCFDFRAHLEDVDVERCKDECANNCSCKAVFYRVSRNISKTWCFLAPEVFSLINTTQNYNYIDKNVTAYIKIQKSSEELLTRSPPAGGGEQNQKMNKVRIILGSVSGAAVIAAILVAAIIMWRKNHVYEDSMQAHTEHIPGLPTGFAFAKLEEVTEKFSMKLGVGGFSSVYEGTFHDGTKVAVKRIDGFGSKKKSFLAEVNVIGSIHHANLVRLLGYCIENSCRLLVYEYMSNGSLDKWIFDKSDGHVPLKWEQRRNIILDVAKGLHYLHEECTQKIIHFDVKPHNILLDGKFRAKVSDFGLSKPIDRDRSRVVTAMKGTPGYLAPEWLRGAITEKVDVYGFGMVILEVVCGRKVYNNHDEDETEGSVLLNLLKSKLAEGCLLDLVDENIDDVDGVNATGMLRLAAWCLQVDSSKRPSMSTAIKILEGVEDIPEDEIKYFFSVAEIYYNFPTPSPLMKHGMGVMFMANVAESAEVGASRLSSAALSGPR